jgi:hypothetical protein
VGISLSGRNINHPLLPAPLDLFPYLETDLLTYFRVIGRMVRAYVQSFLVIHTPMRPFSSEWHVSPPTNPSIPEMKKVWYQERREKNREEKRESLPPPAVYSSYRLVLICMNIRNLKRPTWIIPKGLYQLLGEPFRALL